MFLSRNSDCGVLDKSKNINDSFKFCSLPIENEVPTAGWYNANYIAGTGGLTSSVSTLFPEEAVNEVKRQAMSELQKAVSEAERKAHEMISSERAKMERTVAEAKRQAAEDALSIINQQEDSSEVGTYTYTDTSKHQKVCPQSFEHITTTVSAVLSFGSCGIVVTLNVLLLPAVLVTQKLHIFSYKDLSVHLIIVLVKGCWLFAALKVSLHLEVSKIKQNKANPLAFLRSLFFPQQSS